MTSRLPENFRELNTVFFFSPGPIVAFFIIGCSTFALSKLAFSIWAVLCSSAIVMFRSASEWFFHKYIWHAKGVKFAGSLYVNPIAKMHENHHRNPEDLSGLIFGGYAVAGLSVVVLGLTAIVFGLGNALVILIGYLLSILLYEWFHLLSHSCVKPNSPFLSKVISRHRYHHYKDSGSCYCVSQIWADKLFGTDISSTDFRSNE